MDADKSVSQQNSKGYKARRIIKNMAFLIEGIIFVSRKGAKTQREILNLEEWSDEDTESEEETD